MVTGCQCIVAKDGIPYAEFSLRQAMQELFFEDIFPLQPHGQAFAKAIERVNANTSAKSRVCNRSPCFKNISSAL